MNVMNDIQRLWDNEGIVVRTIAGDEMVDIMLSNILKQPINLKRDTH